MASPIQANPDVPAASHYSTNILQPAGRYIPLNGIKGRRLGEQFDISLRFDSLDAAVFFSNQLNSKLNFKGVTHELACEDSFGYFNFAVTAADRNTTAEITKLFYNYVPVLGPVIHEFVETGAQFSYKRESQMINVSFPYRNILKRDPSCFPEGYCSPRSVDSCHLRITKPVEVGDITSFARDVWNVEGLIISKNEHATLEEIGENYWRDPLAYNAQQSPIPMPPPIPLEALEQLEWKHVSTLPEFAGSYLPDLPRAHEVLHLRKG